MYKLPSPQYFVTVAWTDDDRRFLSDMEEGPSLGILWINGVYYINILKGKIIGSFLEIPNYIWHYLASILINKTEQTPVHFRSLLILIKGRNQQQISV